MFNLWTEHSFHKVRPDEAPKARTSASLCLAKDEYGSFGLVMKSDEAIKVKIAPIKLTDNKENKLCGELLETFYVSIGEMGIVPDPIVATEGEIELKAGEAKTVLVRFHIPCDAEAGEYSGEAEVRVGEDTHKVSLELTVFGFALPKTPSCTTAFQILRGPLERYYGHTRGTPEAKAMYKKYYDALLDYRISAYLLPEDILSPEADKYMDDPRVTSFQVLPFDELEEKDEYAKLTDENLCQYYNKLRTKKEWFDKAYHYPVDEPRDATKFNILYERSERYRRIEPNCNIVAPFFRFPRNENDEGIYSDVVGRMNIWCPVGPFVHEKGSMLGSWALDGKAEDVVSIVSGMNRKNDGGKIMCFDNSLMDEQAINIKFADVTLVAIGESRRVTGEYNSVARLEVDAGYADLLKRAKSFGKPVIAVLCYGRPVALEEIEPYCDAIVWCWHLGTQAGNAIADVLYGDVNPSGKLPMTLPKITGQVPLYYNALPTTHAVDGYYLERYCYRDHSCMPMYQFGYGLSYTDFEISSITLSDDRISLAELENGKKLSASVEVSNIGKVSGKTVVQLYIRDVAARLARPIKELKGYNKLEIEAGESVEVTFDIGFDELAYYVGSNKIVEKGKFELFIGDSCFTLNKVCIEVV